MPQLGDRVIAQWPPEMEWWYPGVIVFESAGEIEVQFDDGGRSPLNPGQAKPLEIPLGAKVQARWQGGQAFYSGKIDDRIGQAIHISYDDGDQEWTSFSLIRIQESELP
jgi:hypothetical protein